jgi:hypothetical protein
MMINWRMMDPEMPSATPQVTVAVAVAGCQWLWLGDSVAVAVAVAAAVAVAVVVCALMIDWRMLNPKMFPQVAVAVAGWQCVSGSGWIAVW